MRNEATNLLDDPRVRGEFVRAACFLAGLCNLVPTNPTHKAWLLDIMIRLRHQLPVDGRSLS